MRRGQGSRHASGEACVTTNKKNVLLVQIGGQKHKKGGERRQWGETNRLPDFALRKKGGGGDPVSTGKSRIGRLHMLLGKGHKVGV